MQGLFPFESTQCIGSQGTHLIFAWHQDYGGKKLHLLLQQS